VPELCVSPPFPPRPILMGANDGAIDDRAGLIDLKLQLAENRRPVAFLGPIREAVVHALPRSEPWWQIAPLQARLRAENHRFDEQAVAAERSRARLLLGQ